MKTIGKLFDAEVEFVSLVKRPANRRTFFFAKQEGGQSELFVPFIKRQVSTDDGTHFVSSVVADPGTLDTDNQYMDPEDIEKAAFSFMMNGPAIDLEHDMTRADGVRIAESYICKSDMELEGQPVKKGSWIMTLGIRNPEIWDKVQNGDYNGFSMFGHGKLIRKSAEPEKPEGVFARLSRWIAERRGKGKGAAGGESGARKFPRPS